jgi:uncharacterized membrane protein
MIGVETSWKEEASLVAMTRFVRGAALVAALGLVGCVSSPDWNAAGTTWNRQETSYAQFEKDKADCEAGPAGQVAECLRNKGYFPWAERSPQERARETLPSF